MTTSEFLNIPPLTAELLSKTLETLLLSPNYMPGQQIPPERALAEQYGVGRPLIREVLRRLEERGLLTIVPGRGNFVRDRKLTESGGSIDFINRQGRVTPQHLITARSMLESEAASLAAIHRTSEDIARMSSLLNRLESAGSLTEVADADVAFHEAVAIASTNPVIQIMFGSIHNLVRGVIVRSLSDVAVRNLGVSSHRPVFELIRDGNSRGASEAMLAHLQVAEDFYGTDLHQPLRDVLEARHLTSD